VPHITTADSYSNEHFESVDQSKSNEDLVLCFLCKQHIPKSQAISHNATCKKYKKAKKYSPIREHPGELQSSVSYSEYSVSGEGKKAVAK